MPSIKQLQEERAPIGTEIRKLADRIQADRKDPSFRLMSHDGILAIIRKLKDGQGRYLFEEGQNGARARSRACGT